MFPYLLDVVQARVVQVVRLFFFNFYINTMHASLFLTMRLTCRHLVGSRAEPRPPPGGRSGVKPIARFVCAIRLQY